MAGTNEPWNRRVTFGLRSKMPDKHKVSESQIQTVTEWHCSITRNDA